MKRLSLLLITTSLLLVSCADSAYAGAKFRWEMLHEDMVEPPLSQLNGWRLEEIPRCATLYYDVTGDGLSDVVFAHPVIAQAKVQGCGSGNENRLDEFYLTLSTCPAEYPMNYFVTKQYTMFRLLNDKVWSKVMQMVGQR